MFSSQRASPQRKLHHGLVQIVRRQMIPAVRVHAVPCFNGASTKRSGKLIGSLALSSRPEGRRGSAVEAPLKRSGALTYCPRLPCRTICTSGWNFLLREGFALRSKYLTVRVRRTSLRYLQAFFAKTNAIYRSSPRGSRPAGIRRAGGRDPADNKLNHLR